MDWTGIEYVVWYMVALVVLAVVVFGPAIVRSERAPHSTAIPLRESLPPEPKETSEEAFLRGQAEALARVKAARDAARDARKHKNPAERAMMAFGAIQLENERAFKASSKNS